MAGAQRRGSEEEMTAEAAGAEIRGGKSRACGEGRGLAAGGQVGASLRLVGASLRHVPTEGLGGRCQNRGGKRGNGGSRRAPPRQSSFLGRNSSNITQQPVPKNTFSTKKKTQIPRSRLRHPSKLPDSSIPAPAPRMGLHPHRSRFPPPQTARGVVAGHKPSAERSGVPPSP